MADGDSLEAHGSGAAAYADAIATFLGMTISKVADYGCSLAVWYPKEDRPKNLFARHAIPMTWDYPEVNPLSSIGGTWSGSINVVTAGMAGLGSGVAGIATQSDAATAVVHGGLISTDPPYYDNIGYSDLSDFFYVWLRRSLGSVHPDLLSTLLVPKADELVANPFRHGGADGARDFFERGFTGVFADARVTALPDFPITVFYAFKQAETETAGTASTGWETLLDGMIRSGWTITATWPMRSERVGRMRDVGSNALASSVVLALRPRPEDAPVVDRRGFVTLLKVELPERLQDLQQGNIAPVDLPQAAIGPGMAVYSRYSRVVEPDGSSLSVREALRLINHVLAEVLSEQEGDFDAGTRWCVKWFETHGFAPGAFGTAETLASAYNVSVSGLANAGVITSGGGVVQLVGPDALSTGYDPRTDDKISAWEVIVHLGRALRKQGLDDAARIYGGAVERGVDLEAVRALAYLAFSLAEKRKDSDSAQLFNDLVTSWTDIALLSGRTPAAAVQLGFSLDDD